MRLRQRTRSVRTTWAPSRVRRVVRHRGSHAAVIMIVGCVASLVLAGKIAALDTERAGWGQTRPVVVVLAGVDRGDPVHGSVELRDYPLAVVPADAATSFDVTTVARVDLHPGEIVLSNRLTTGNEQAAAGSVALTLPVARQVPLIEVGALVDLWSVDSANFTSHRIASSVAVLAFSDDDITVAVTNEQVGQATAASLRPVIVTIVG